MGRTAKVQSFFESVMTGFTEQLQRVRVKLPRSTRPCPVIRSFRGLPNPKYDFIYDGKERDRGTGTLMHQHTGIMPQQVRTSAETSVCYVPYCVV